MAFLQGAIVMWGGSIENIPNGWALCDGQNGTPDLRNKFVISVGTTYAVGNTGGSADSIVVQHSHTGTTSTDGAHIHVISGRQTTSTAAVNTTLNTTNGTFGSSSAGTHSHTYTFDNAGESGTNKNLPPYYALAFIMQIS